jgi:hypothetical protein
MLSSCIFAPAIRRCSGCIRCWVHAGSVAGAAGTYLIGVKIGDAGLSRFRGEAQTRASAETG